MTHTPGPELDAKVAAACGLKHVEEIRHPKHDWQATGEGNVYGSAYLCHRCFEDRVTDDIDYDGEGECVVTISKSFSTDLNAAFEAAEKVGLFKATTIGKSGHETDEPWYVERSHETQHGSRSETIGRGPTPALAICVAILKLKGQE